jgi:periplasmic divalent cation tolerance protein
MFGENQVNSSHYLIVLITTPSAEVGQNIANALVDQGLAACVNILSPIHSIYLWQGKKQSDEETLLIVKTTQDAFSDKLVPAVKEIHPYDVPEIIALPIIFGSEDYLRWIDENTGKGRRSGEATLE